MPRHILIVDDDVNMKTALTGALESCGYRVSLAGTEEEASVLLAGINGNVVDMIIIDIELPRMTGMSLLHRLRNEGSTLPSIIISGTDKKFMINMLNKGLTHFIEQAFMDDYNLPSESQIEEIRRKGQQ
jgi:DNA-binding response OmpR family regulator